MPAPKNSILAGKLLFSLIFAGAQIVITVLVAVLLGVKLEYSFWTLLSLLKAMPPFSPSPH